MTPRTALTVVAWMSCISTIDPDRANVYEAWTDAHSLETFRGSGPDDPSFAFIVRADVERHEISHSGPP